MSLWKKHKQQPKNDKAPPLPPTTPASAVGSNENGKNGKIITAPSSPQPQAPITTSAIEMKTPILNEDYVDIGMDEEEGDYSTPAVRNYELDRSQIQLNEIIGVGQFGDVHIGTWRLSKSDEHNSSAGSDISSLDGSGSINGCGNDKENKSVLQVAVRTCKADSDMITSEKFLQ